MLLKIIRLIIFSAMTISIGNFSCDAFAFTLNSQSSQIHSLNTNRMEHIAQRRTVPARFNRRVVKYKTNLRRGTIIVDSRKKFLYHIIGNGKAWRYGVGVGKSGFNWSGSVTINRKAKWPGWTPPAAMRAREARKGRKLPRYMAGGPRNPLGARALYLYRGGRDTLYRIHGTNNPRTIGLNVSSGCIRLRNEDVAHLYDRIRLGSRVIVR